ncbi:CRISPR-associated protein Cas5 [Desulfotruncus alcoholivorax]|uniref:CRISPR-associated protein Cas5 n=1 Tax=Desulfotruncus alcoholivorax TaxID=265477 RepID=UPI0004141AEF|nr:CRISPR-associated protein Cas5 [Desulfotruncus alcoholivorax]
MNILSFRLKGKMGHFRRYYSNSSSLTYSIPPRTTICGILAGILGMERDSYYEQFSVENCDIALALLSPIKKQIHTLNLLMIKSDNDLNGSQEFHTQIPTEMILPANIRSGELHYQIWVHHKNTHIMNVLHEVLGQADYGYGSRYIPVSLGTAYHLGWLEYDGIIKGVECYSEDAEDALEFDSVLPINCLKQLCLDAVEIGDRFIREELPLEFDKDRRLTANGMGDVLINLSASHIKAKVHSYVKLGELNQRIVWLK